MCSATAATRSTPPSPPSSPRGSPSRCSPALAPAGTSSSRAPAYIFEILEPILVSTPEAAAVFAPDGRALREGEPFRDADLGDTIERFGAEGAEPFYGGDIGAAIVDWLEARGGQLTRADLAA